MNVERLSLINLTRPEIRANPYPFYAELQREEPVHWDEPRKSWVITRYADVTAVLRDRRFSNARGLEAVFARLPEEARVQASPIQRFFSSMMHHTDPPYHTRLRGLVSKAFTPRVVEQMRPLVQRVTDDLLDAAANKEKVDVILDFAYPLPLTVVAHLLGVQAERHDQLKKWSENVVAAVGMPRHSSEVIQLAVESIAELTAYIQPMITELRERPNDGLMSGMVAAADQGEHLSSEELVSSTLLLLIAGHETTTNLIANGVLLLLQHPDQLEKLRKDPSLVENAADEILRYDSSVQMVNRVAMEDIEIGGKQIGRGQMVTLVLGAANRDPDQFKDPDRFDVSRPEIRYTSLGMGMHYCLGAPLVKLEVPIALGTLLRRFPSVRLASDDVAWRETPSYRGPKALHVHLR